MVDFALINRLSTQQAMITALFSRRIHRRILVITRDLIDTERMHHEIVSELRETVPHFQVNRPTRASFRIATPDSVCNINIIATAQMPSIRGVEHDLVWFRFLSGEESKAQLEAIIVSCRLGYNPLVLWGNVPTNIKEIYERVN